MGTGILEASRGELTSRSSTVFPFTSTSMPGLAFTPVRAVVPHPNHATFTAALEVFLALFLCNMSASLVISKEDFNLTTIAQLAANNQTSLLNLYTSPSIFITPRSRSAPELIRAVHPDRLLIESDSHDVRLSTRAVWAAVKWVAGCRGEGWKVEDDDAEWERVADDKKLEEGESASKSGGGDDTKSGDIEKDRMESNTPIGGSKGEVDANATGDTASRAVKVDGKKQQQKKKKKRGPGGVRDTDGRIWTVRTLERNWARFMRLIDDVEE